MSTVDLTGRVFDRLTVIGYTGRSQGGHKLWMCRCRCGRELPIQDGNLGNGHTRSCGCLRHDSAVLTTNKYRTHGQSSRQPNRRRTSEYMAWDSMLQRCENPNLENYPDYGGRGIAVCERWHKFEHFIEDMGMKSSPELSLDRIDNDQGYYKGNCRWATVFVQQHNRRSTKLDETKVSRIRDLIAQGIPQWVIGKRYDIDQSVVSRINTDRAWRVAA